MWRRPLQLQVQLRVAGALSRDLEPAVLLAVRQLDACVQQAHVSLEAQDVVLGVLMCAAGEHHAHEALHHEPTTYHEPIDA